MGEGGALRLGDIRCGTEFVFRGRYYVKTSYKVSGMTLCASQEDGVTAFFPDDQKLEIVEDTRSTD